MITSYFIRAIPYVVYILIHIHTPKMVIICYMVNIIVYFCIYLILPPQSSYFAAWQHTSESPTPGIQPLYCSRALSLSHIDLYVKGTTSEEFGRNPKMYRSTCEK